MPVWALDPEGAGEDILISSTRLGGSDLFVEALCVEDDYDPVPVPSGRGRFRRSVAAAGDAPTFATMRLPGRDGCYVIFGAAAPDRLRILSERGTPANWPASPIPSFFPVYA